MLLVGFHDSIHDGVSCRSRLCEEAPTNIVACFPDGVFCGGLKKNGSCATQQADRVTPGSQRGISASVHLLYTKSEHSNWERKPWKLAILWLSY